MSSQGWSVEIRTFPIPYPSQPSHGKEGVLQYMFDLRDIDLRSVRFDDGMLIVESISFRTGGGVNRSIMVNGKRGGTMMFFDLNKEYGPTFVKAFKRAITLANAIAAQRESLTTETQVGGR